MQSFFRRTLATVSLVCAIAASAHGQIHLRDICRVKGQEENTLTGLGLVVGLKGTGDGDSKPTQRALATMMKMHGNPLAQGPGNIDDIRELKDAKNVALVWITATVPAEGRRQGDLIDCHVSAISATSLVGGTLLPTPLLGPVGSNRVFGFAQGLLALDDSSKPVTARITKGCRLEADFINRFLNESGVFTLVLDQNHSSFEIVQDITEQINTQASTQALHRGDRDVARALGPVNIEITVPDTYANDPVSFVAQILEMRIFNPQTRSKVIINERAETIVIGAEVQVGAVVLSHKNLVIEPPDPASAARFVELDTSNAPVARLKDLVDALNEIRLPTKDIIQIIKTLEASGKLHGQVVIQ
jgi:flagellar P-ring protein precursor FlgI